MTISITPPQQQPSSADIPQNITQLISLLLPRPIFVEVVPAVPAPDEEHCHQASHKFVAAEALAADLLVAQVDVLSAVVVVGVDGHGDLVEGVEEGDDLVPLVGSGVSEQYLEGSADAIGLGLAKQPALLALDTVQNLRDVVDVTLILPHLRVARGEELQRLLLLRGQVVTLQLAQQLVHQLPRLHVLPEVVGLDGEVMVEVLGRVDYRLAQQPVEEDQVSDPVRVLEHSPLVLACVEMELALLDAGLEVGPCALPSAVFVEATEVGGDAGVEPGDKGVEDVFLGAELGGGVVLGAEAVFLVDEAPDVGAVVVGKGLDVLADVEVLALVVGLVLDVPDPAVLQLLALVGPHVEVVHVRLHLLSDGPRLRDVLLVAPAHAATLALADTTHHPQLALLIDVQPDYPEVLQLDQPLQQRRTSLIHPAHRVHPQPRHSLHPPQPAEKHHHRQNHLPSPHPPHVIRIILILNHHLPTLSTSWFDLGRPQRVSQHCSVELAVLLGLTDGVRQGRTGLALAFAL